MSDPQEELKNWLADKLKERGAQTKLAKALNLTDTKVSRMKNLKGDKESRAIELHEIPIIAKFFGELPPGYEQMTNWLDDAPVTQAQLPKPNASFPPQHQRLSSTKTVPLLGQTESGPDGRFILNGLKIADIFCPPVLENVPDAYAVRVYGTSMEPRYRAGETVWLNPQIPVKSGDDVVVQLKPSQEGDPLASYIKEFRSRSSKVLRLWQHNPEEGHTNEIEIDNDDVFSVHAVVYASRYS